MKLLRFLGSERAIEECELREVPVQGREVIAARAEEKVRDARSGDLHLRIDLRLHAAIEIHAHAPSIANEHRVIPGARRDHGLARGDLVAGIAVEDEEPAGEVASIGAADAEMIAGRLRVAIRTAGEKIRGDGGGIVRRFIAKPQRHAEGRSRMCPCGCECGRSRRTRM